ncbi:Piso0_002881 [Millerozyma farinosa CBS 7064]|uniref:Piso0_002881 protein n=1 Tax=Pichia sorbitophila (strain ATCC MYA-4447 / BCRC 22081 / CBS 7064 / NBRC 10061 / NRRL Y-12695) TaxID=559304 RepID=G8YDS1_PICSO|nr:Piso0_002881 [Millerozyma farinosa CBS 7064]
MIPYMAGNLLYTSLLLNLLFGSIIFISFLLATHHEILSEIIKVRSRGEPGEHVSSERLCPFDNFEKNGLDWDNSTAIFNIVHGSLKQKGGVLNPIGAAFIPAYIPPNTYFYHSTESNQVPDSFEWIAMSSEFSYSFASFPRNIQRQHPPPPEHSTSFTVPGNTNYLRIGDNSKPYARRDFLYGFRTTIPFTKLIFLDGASASKRDTGEMDQQLLLGNLSNVHSWHFGERYAAEKICEWGRPFGLQGVIRLEIGFEIILCDFKNGVELVSNVSLSNVTELIGFPGETPVPNGNLEKNRTELMDIFEGMSGLEILQSGANVDTGERRILLDFSRMVTPINKTWLNPDPYRRRLANLSTEIKEDILETLEFNLREYDFQYKSTDWQLITNNIVNKFGPMLLTLNSSLTKFEHSKTDIDYSLKQVAKDLSRLTYNFVRRYSDEAIQNTTLREEKMFRQSVEDYVYHTYPIRSASERLIYSSLFVEQSAVSRIILDVFKLSKAILNDLYVTPTKENYMKFRYDVLSTKTKLVKLLEDLRWPIFTQCFSKCKWDEVCYVPTWGPSPIGMGPEDPKNHRWFDFDGERYRIGHTLPCIGIKDML